MTERALTYETEPYRTELETRIVDSGSEAGREFAALEDTILYPGGGGQPSDHGSLNGVQVLEVGRVAGRVLHYLAEPVSTGGADLKLDWRRRYDHMQQHTAQHLLSAIALDAFGWATTSFHLGDARCDIELDVESVPPEALAAIEERMMREIRAARPVSARRISAEDYRSLEIRTRGLPEDHRGDVRLVEIEGIDVTTCGGTHLASTAEIESVSLGPTEHLRGGTRLFWIAGGRVRRRLASLERRNRELRRLFETSGDELVGAAEAKLAALKDARKAMKRGTRELAEAKASALAAAPEATVEAHFNGADAGLLQTVARGLLSQAPAKRALLTASGERGDFFVVAAGPESGVEAAQVGPRVAEALGGRGGGSGAVFQGKATSLAGRPAALALLEQE